VNQQIHAATVVFITPQLFVKPLPRQFIRVGYGTFPIPVRLGIQKERTTGVKIGNLELPKGEPGGSMSIEQVFWPAGHAV